MQELMVERVPGWSSYGWLRHGFSTRAGGASTVYGGSGLNLGLTREDAAALVLRNRELFLEAVSGGEGPGGGAKLAMVRQVHGAGVVRVGAGVWDAVEADGMVTGEPGVMLGIQVADCVPVLVADTRQRVVGAFHAGWRGTVAGIAGVGVARMREEFGSEPGEMIAAIGPSIRACCYRVGDEVRVRFKNAFGYASELFSGAGIDRLDLAEANRRQLVDAGLRADAVTVLDACTACARLDDGSRKYFSHRAEDGVTGRAMGMIGVL